MSFNHVCAACEVAWRDDKQTPTPCWSCRTPTAVGQTIQLSRLVDRRQVGEFSFNPLQPTRRTT